ncbi:hypothetical protein [Pseudoduganella chitinolytica]|uniref:TonB C-terminal domain-containing protein n=1 Tax=Pseudoduganella chitinolytica TaxID=34070 RepID=A0ABY8BGI9_9BURK|nr:hypothetical protein [Pseudoduganella chitinolytica]WEF35040.1 hypothetical protein PX653_09840 [Pseudoduganella chitinolytica]
MHPLSYLVASAALALAGIAAAQDTTYAFRDQPRTGSHLRRNVAFAPIPFDKRYADLSDAQKGIVRAAYERMAADDEPPFPVNGLAPIFRALARLEKGAVHPGPIKASVTVDPAGMPLAVRILTAPGDDLGDFVGRLLLLQRYKPALCAGRPCGQEFLLAATLTDE